MAQLQPAWPQTRTCWLLQASLPGTTNVPTMMWPCSTAAACETTFFEKPCQNTHLVSLQLGMAGQSTQIAAAYWRPASSARSTDISTAALDVVNAGPGNHILLANLNRCVACVEERVMAQRSDTRSRAVARWLRESGLAPCHSGNTHRSGPYCTKMDHIFVPSSQVVNADGRWTEDSDHALLTCTIVHATCIWSI